jgi:hypothetical protein
VNELRFRILSKSMGFSGSQSTFGTTVPRTQTPWRVVVLDRELPTFEFFENLESDHDDGKPAS